MALKVPVFAVPAAIRAAKPVILRKGPLRIYGMAIGDPAAGRRRDDDRSRMM
jgi:hypothetical protein